MTSEERVAALEAQVTAQDAPTDYYTSVYSGEQIDQAVGIALNGSAGENFLDNAYFVGGGSQQGQFPINQRGQTSWSAAGPMFDRWKLVSGTASLTAAGVTLNGTMAQVLENDPPGTTTATALTTTGIVNCTYDSGTKTFTITGTGETFLAAKLELGSTQSLAREDDSGNWNVLEIPKFGAELAECQRYLVVYDVNGQRFCGYGTLDTTTSVQALIITPVQMRATPNISGDLSIYLPGVNLSATSVIVQVVGPSGVRVNLVVPTASTSGQVIMLHTKTTLTLSAEL